MGVTTTSRPAVVPGAFTLSKTSLPVWFSSKASKLGTERAGTPFTIWITSPSAIPSAGIASGERWTGKSGSDL